MSGALEITGLRVERDAGLLLDIASLSLEEGTVTVVTGPADAGKTLLAAVLCGRAAPSAGTVSLHGRLLTGTPSTRRRAGLAGTVADGRRIAGCTVDEALRLAGSARAAAAIERLPLLRLRAAVLAELLSGGEQHLLQVACAWCAGARVLVLDAPTTGLAADAVSAVADLATSAASEGAAVLWLDQDAALAPARPSWRLDAGRISPEPEAGSPSAPA